MDHTFRSEKKLETFLRMLAEESVNKVREDALIGEDGAEEEIEAAPEDSEEAPEEEGPEEESETDLDDETAVKKEDDTEAVPSGEDITFYMLRDKLNVIRSGKSLKDADVKGDLQEYVDRLEDIEKEALYIFLDSIGKIMLDEISGSEAEEPSGPIDMQHTDDSDHEHDDSEESEHGDNEQSDAPSPEND
ncbi:MAG TPA: hypothetical protein EYQ74_12960, partial [Planctomycetes bacterium]|nr:hypothetical protein [Planctomycetota bacterium]